MCSTDPKPFREAVQNIRKMNETTVDLETFLKVDSLFDYHDIYEIPHSITLELVHSTWGEDAEYAGKEWIIDRFDTEIGNILKKHKELNIPTEKSIEFLCETYYEKYPISDVRHTINNLVIGVASEHIEELKKQ